MDTGLSSQGGTTKGGSILGGYRPSYSSGGRSISINKKMSYGQRNSSMGDEAFDSSINFGDEISFGDSDAPRHTTTTTTTAAHNKSLVDIFLAEDNNINNTENLNEFHPVPMKSTPAGNQIKKLSFYLCLGIVFLVIFITAPKRGFMMNTNKSTNNNEEETENPTKMMTNETEIPLSSTTITTTTTKGEPQEEQIQEEGIHVDMDRPQAIHAFLLENKVSTVEDLKDENTPASLAMNWMATTDSAELDVPGYPYNKHNVGTQEEQGKQFLQRYALACLYFSMEDSNNSGEQTRTRRRRKRNLVGGTRKAQAEQEEEEDNRLQFDDHWTVKDNVCDWFGVECNNENYVTAVDLKHTRLDGKLAPEIFQEAALPYLTSLDLSHNSIKGTIPSSSQLHNVNNKLEALLMEHNKIQGTLDPVTKRLPGLIELNLQANQLSGTLPEDWSLLSNLEVMKLASNQLSGTLSPGLGNLVKLEWLQLDRNELIGSIPTDFSQLEHLRSLKIAFNRIGGTLPEFLADLRLYHVSLQNNRFSGTVPTSLGKMTMLEDLHLHITNLVGTMPEEVCALLTADDMALRGLSADCKEPEIVCSCCTACY